METVIWEVKRHDSWRVTAWPIKGIGHGSAFSKKLFKFAKDGLTTEDMRGTALLAAIQSFAPATVREQPDNGLGIVEATARHIDLNLFEVKYTLAD